MIYGTIGLLVGIVMGLTGAGGALIAIPLFMNLLEASLKEATVLSLVAVVFGTSVNLLGQFSRVNKKIALTLGAAGAVSNYLTLPLKTGTPEVVIAGLLTLIGVFSVTSVWRRKDQSHGQSDESPAVAKALMAGTFLGLITTLTGLGGGVLLLPILLKVFKKTYQEALPTSLATILLISLTSFIFQSKTALNLMTYDQLALIGGGALASYFMLKLFLRKLEERMLLLIRQIVFTVVTVYSVLSVIVKTM